MDALKIFVGRARELAELQTALHGAVDGRGGLFLISGEPGIGKTRVLSELADRAASRGLRVLWGRCWEGEGAPANWPWIQVVRALAATTEPAEWSLLVGSGAPYLSQLVPELRAASPADHPEPAPSEDPESARFQLFDSVTTLLRRAAAHEPLVLVLDDFHAADLPSLRLLQFLGRQLRDARMLVVVAFREVEMRARATAGEILADLAREGRPLHLQGLAEPDVARLIETTAGAVAPADLVSAVHRTTEGNPFFIGEMARHLIESGAMVQREGQWTTDRPLDQLGLPAGVKEVVVRRLTRLSPACNHLLTLAAAIGREFGLDALESVSSIDRTHVLEAMEEAIGARVVAEMPRVLGRYTFCHVLIRETLYDQLTSTHRLALHSQIGEVLEQLYAVNPEPHLAELAYHFLEAAPRGDVSKAIEYARRAAQRATTSLAYEEAARLYRLAVECLDDHEPTDDGRRCELLLAQGDAETRAGGLNLATATFQRAADVARRLGASGHFARAALGFGGRLVYGVGATDDRLIALLEESLAVLGDEPSALRVLVMARLATALYGRVIFWRDSLDRCASLSRQAVAMARDLADTATLAYALDARYTALWGPDGVKERLAIATEMLRLAEKAGDRERTYQAHHWLMLAMLELGDVRAADVEIAEQARLADELRQPAQLWSTGVTRALRALLEGRLDEGERLAEQAQEIGRYPSPVVSGRGLGHDRDGLLFGAQRFLLRWQQGRLQEREATLKATVERYPGAHFPRSYLALLYSELGREKDARRELEQAATNDFADLPRDALWLAIVTHFSEVCAFVRDSRRANTLYEMLLPYADRSVVLHIAVCYGSAARSLGLLAASMGRWDEAARHFENALVMNARMGARLWVARTQYDYAAMLLAHGEQGERDRARSLVTEARDTALELGMTALVEKANALEQRLGPAPVDAHDRNVFRREGDFWTIAHRGRTFAVRDMKGLQYIARLLREPARQIHCMELLAEENGSSAEDRERLRELMADLDDAESRHDVGQATRVRAERDLLVEKLARATGLGEGDAEGMRARERARVNVSRTIKDAIARIREHDAALARHLANAIRTGAWCSYVPEPGAELAWSL